jgi:outer membrane protein OmpA-like peptidoglycan-associated protein
MLMLSTESLAAGDLPGSEDNPLLKRYEGSTIIKYTSNAFDAYTLPVGPATGEFNQARLTESVKLEGKLTRLTYRVPPGRSAVEVIRNYESELEKAGFTVLYEGAGADLGNKVSKVNFADAAGYNGIRIGDVPTLRDIVQLGEHPDRFLAATLDRPEGSVHVALYGVTASPYAVSGLALGNVLEPGQVVVQVDIIEQAPMEAKMVTVSASEMASSIATQGSVALYGILFDTNSAEVKAESMPTLQNMATLLKDQPALKLLVVGHTDNVGTFDFNMDLSKRRAASVVQMLAAQHGIDQSRLTPVGVSFASPVASNKSEQGRAKNRRVQLVEN